MHNLHHNHQSQGAYLHPASYSAGVLPRGGDVFDNRKYLKYKLVFCDNKKGPLSPVGESGREDAYDTLIFDEAKSVLPVTPLPIGVDLDAINRILEPGKTPLTLARKLLRDTFDTAESMVDLFYTVARGDLLVAGGEIPIKNNIGNSFGTSAAELEKGKWKLIGLLWDRYCGPLLGNPLDADTAIDAISLDGTSINANNAKVESDGAISERSSRRKIELLTKAFPDLAAEAGKSEKYALSALPSEIVAILMGKRPEAVTFADVDTHFILAMQRSTDRSIAELQQKKDGCEKKANTCGIQILRLSQDQEKHRKEIVRLKAEEDAHQKSAEGYRNEIGQLEKKKKEIENTMPMPIFKALTMEGKGGETEILVELLEGIAELARICEGKEGDQKAGALQRAQEINPAKFSLFRLSSTIGSGESENGTLEYLMARDWRGMFEKVFGTGANIPKTALESHDMAAQRSEQFRGEFVDDCKKAFEKIEAAKDILEIYTHLPAAATKIMAQHQEDWDHRLNTRKINASQGETKFLVTKNNFPLYYTLDPHSQELFRVLLSPPEQDRYLSINALELESDENVNEAKNELTKLLLRRLKDFAKNQLLSSKGFDDLNPEQKVQMGAAFCHRPEDVELFISKADFIGETGPYRDYFAKLLGEKDPPLSLPKKKMGLDVGAKE